MGSTLIDLVGLRVDSSFSAGFSVEREELELLKWLSEANATEVVVATALFTILLLETLVT